MAPPSLVDALRRHQALGQEVAKVWRRSKEETNRLLAKQARMYSVITSHGTNPTVVYMLKGCGPSKDDVPQCSLHFLEERDAEKHRTRMPIPEEYVVVMVEWRTLNKQSRLRVILPTEE